MPFEDDEDLIGAAPRLHEAAERGDALAIQRLINRFPDSDVSEVYSHGLPLHLCCVNGYPEAAQVLIDNKADPNALDVYGQSPLHCACFEGHAGVAAVLIKARAQVDMTTSAEKLTALLWACVNGHEDCVRLLLDAKANPNARKDNGRTPLHVASVFGSAACVKPLLEAKADVNAKDDDGDAHPNKGKTALQRAEEEGHTEIANLLRNLQLQERMRLMEEEKATLARASLPLVPKEGTARRVREGQRSTRASKERTSR